MSLKKLIIEQALSLGFDAVGITNPQATAAAGRDLHEFLARGHHGDMYWLSENVDRRSDPAVLWPEAKSVIVVGHNYAPAEDPLPRLEQKSIGNISCYAQNKDYHDVMKKKLRQLAREIATKHNCDVKLFVDTAPVMEKPLAQAAGIGWQGKHTCLVSREFGSWLFIGSIFTTLELPTDNSETDHCGTCSKCLDICPTNAFTAPRELDARRCISYLTIEHKGQIPLEFRKAIGNRIYGCDDCLAVCPWNKFAQAASEAAYHPREALITPRLKELAALDDAAFRQMFSGSPIKRIGRDRFVRNVLIAIGNSNDASLMDDAKPLLQDNSPLVAEMAAWALGELAKTA